MKHSNFLKVKVLVTAPHNEVQIRSPRRCQGRARYSPSGRTGRPQQKSNYELLTATTLIYAIGAGITAAAGHCRAILCRRVSRLSKASQQQNARCFRRSNTERRLTQKDHLPARGLDSCLGVYYQRRTLSSGIGLSLTPARRRFVEQEPVL